MREFDLVSINWDTVRLLQAGQFKQETVYHEELLRWALQRSGIFGVIRMEEDSVSLPTPEGDRMFSVKVRGCSGVAAMGSIVEIPEEREAAIQGLVEAHGATVPLYVGVARTERAIEPSLRSAKDTGLMHCGGLRAKYILST